MDNVIDDIIDELQAMRSLVNEEIDRIVSLLDTGHSIPQTPKEDESLPIDMDTEFILPLIPEGPNMRYRSAPVHRRPRALAESEVETYWSARPGRYISPRLLAEKMYAESPDEVDYFSSSWGTACRKFLKEGKMEVKSERGINYYTWKKKKG